MTANSTAWLLLALAGSGSLAIAEWVLLTGVVTIISGGVAASLLVDRRQRDA